MDILKKEILQKWLCIEFANIAAKTGYIPNIKIEIPFDLIARTIRILDRETTKKREIDKNYVISLIALIWQYIEHDKYDIRILITRFLTRIGYPTSAIVTDKKFDKDRCLFSSFNNIFDQIVVSAKLARNEIIIAEQSYLLTDFQKQIWESLEQDKNICVSAPTSAGKSFVLLLNLVNRLLRQSFDIVYVVPTLSLVNQVTEDFYSFIKKLNINNCIIQNDYYDNDNQNISHIYILTQEKVMAAVLEYNKAFSRNLVLVVDEIQNIERILDKSDDRSRILFDVLLEFKIKKNVIQRIIAGPRIDSIGKIGKKLWGSTAKEISTNISPVLNITYSICKTDGNYFFKQYNNLINEPIVKKIVDTSFIGEIGKKVFSESYLSSLNKLLLNIGVDNQNIVFAPTPKEARKIAFALQGQCQKEEADELIKYYKDTVHPNYSLCEVISKGVAYHHGKLPQHVRRTLEIAISKKIISTVVCTTTLMQGINLPAQNIIIRNPHLYLRKSEFAAELSDYEMANLRGRAGRLMKEFIGRTFVLDENEFAKTDGYNNNSLFEDTKKELPIGYKDKFDEYANDIRDVVLNDFIVDESMQNYGFLVTYIRQSVLRYGEKSVTKVNKVGIKLSKEQISAIKQKLDQIEIPHRICLQNRYWDPLVLNFIYKNYSGVLPISLNERGAKKAINNIMIFLRDNKETCFIFERYIPQKYRRGQQRRWLLDIAFNWARGVSLKKILSDIESNHVDDMDRIDETIEVLQNIVSYNMPLLFKPLFDIKQPNNCVLASLKSGASEEYVINMIQMGIPRETSLFLWENLQSQLKFNKVASKTLKEIILASIDRYPYWVRMQLRFLDAIK